MTFGMPATGCAACFCISQSQSVRLMPACRFTHAAPLKNPLLLVQQLATRIHMHASVGVVCMTCLLGPPGWLQTVHGCAQENPVCNLAHYSATCLLHFHRTRFQHAGLSSGPAPSCCRPQQSAGGLPLLGGDHKHDQPVRAASGCRHCNSRSLCNVGDVLHTGSLQLHRAHLYTTNSGLNPLTVQQC